MIDKVMFSSNTDEWATPDDFCRRYGAFDLDPCATAANAKAPRFYTKQDDGLSQKWEGRVWLNPPYGKDIGLWVKKAAESKCEVVALLPARTDTKWFHQYVLPYAKIEFVCGRLKFGGSKNSAPFPSIVAHYMPEMAANDNTKEVAAA